MNNSLSLPALTGYKGAAIALLAGTIMPLAFAPFHWYPLAVLSLLLLFVSWQETTPKQAFWRGCLFGLGMFGVGVSWVFVAIHVFGEASVPLAVLLTGLFVAALSVYIGVLGALVRRISSPRFSLTDLLLLLPFAWLLMEWFKGWFLTGFPWLDIGVSQIDGPLAGWIPVIGVFGVTWLVALTAALLLAALGKRHGWPALLALAIWLGGWSAQQLDWTQPTDSSIKATLIQGNIPQEIKWHPEQLRHTLELYEGRTQSHWDSDLVVWPENAVTAFYHQLEEFYFQPLAEQARQHNTDILLGLPYLDHATDNYYNSMMLLGNGEAFYHKQHLVPFGDYVPFETLRGLIAFFDLPMSSFSKGRADQPLIEAAGEKVAISICYEDTFTSQVRSGLPQATLLVNATNNAWYGDSFAPHQHLQISRSRALETGRPMLRVTTNGISAFIDFKGQLERQTAQFVEATLTHEVQPRTGSTPYVFWGRWPLAILTLLGLGLWWHFKRKVG